MLKIKDNVDLKELEKYGLKKSNTYSDWYPIGSINFDGEDFTGWFEINGYDFIDYELKYEPDTLYDLIKDGLVEKVKK